LRQRLQAIRAAGGEYKVMSSRGEIACEGSADAGGGAGNQGQWAGSWHQVVSWWFC
jgi:hypothetical protein